MEPVVAQAAAPAPSPQPQSWGHSRKRLERDMGHAVGWDILGNTQEGLALLLILLEVYFRRSSANLRDKKEINASFQRFILIIFFPLDFIEISPLQIAGS